LKNFLLFLFIAFVPFAFSQIKPKQKSGAKDTKFNIQIQGIVLDNCSKTSDIAFGEFHGSDAEIQKMKPNAKEEFTASYWLKEPGLFFFRKGSVSQYFLVSQKEKMYKIGLSCNKNELEPLQVFSSTENKAYQEFMSLRKGLTADFENFNGKNLNDTLIFKEFSGKLRDYQRKAASLAKKYPNSYVANRLVAVDRVSEVDLSSIEKLRQNFLKRQAFADHKFYNTMLPSLIMENYLKSIMDKDDSSFTAFEWVLNIASKNTPASQRLQDVLYETINKSKRKDLMRSYIYWAKAHPDKMVNEMTKFKLEGLSKSMVDAQFINISLKDTLGKTNELKDVVTASKYTLLTIYNPDCSHCIETLPKLIPIWEKYQSKGLKIFTVAAKNDNTMWINFIKKYTGAGWINVMEDQTNSSFGKYSITSLPSFVLIDAQGKIVSRMVATEVVAELQKWLAPL
jgi:thiol-disulfide isomerase/thioredoxin